ncbi:TrpB-like pyridoxal phosphate-dependent enzyme [Streptomyces avermitilis]|uniref:TrpB-like pyridoxal phosphate-dependent enzyme n=1 Tax=Streptomyces avermitilis TaxID=33903 RepID=UPI0033D77D1F
MTIAEERATANRFVLSEDEVPQRWYNLVVDLPYEIEPPLHSTEERPALEEDYDWLWPTECLRIEFLKGRYATDPWIEVPEPVLRTYTRYRPSTLVRAKGLEEYLDTPHRIFYKREDLNPGGSHKFNTALAQAYYAAQDGVETLVTDTGAGQWGTALALACAAFGLKLKVFMVRKSFDEKPYRRNLMRMLGAEVISSPSRTTRTGRDVLEKDPDSPGSLGIGMAEAIELVRSEPSHRLALGCMSYYAAMHQTVIGLETQAQLAQAGVGADVLVGCVGGGSNFTGFVAPFVTGTGTDRPLCIAAEPASVPTLTQGEFRYDWADYERQTPRIPMYTLGSDRRSALPRQDPDSLQPRQAQPDHPEGLRAAEGLRGRAAVPAHGGCAARARELPRHPRGHRGGAAWRQAAHHRRLPQRARLSGPAGVRGCPRSRLTTMSSVSADDAGLLPHRRETPFLTRWRSGRRPGCTSR